MKAFSSSQSPDSHTEHRGNADIQHEIVEQLDAMLVIELDERVDHTLKVIAEVAVKVA